MRTHEELIEIFKALGVFQGTLGMTIKILPDKIKGTWEVSYNEPKKIEKSVGFNYVTTENTAYYLYKKHYDAAQESSMFDGILLMTSAPAYLTFEESDKLISWLFPNDPLIGVREQSQLI